MRIDHQIAVLRSDAALQRCTQAPLSAAKKAWAASPGVDPLLAELRQFGEGAALGQLGHLRGLLYDREEAQRFVGEWTARFCDALSQNALGQVPFRHSYSGNCAAIQFARCGRAALSLMVYDPVQDGAEPVTANFADRDQFELVLSGEGMADVRRLDDIRNSSQRPCVSSSRLALKPGITLDTSGPNLARHISGVRSSLVILQLARAPISPQPSREIRLSDGIIIHQACGHKRSSQNAMAIEVLGAMNRLDAAPVMKDIALQSGPDHLR
ncbi:MAG: hypothetical protein ABJP34_13105 [Erythrobacter sp.]